MSVKNAIRGKFPISTDEVEGSNPTERFSKLSRGFHFGHCPVFVER